MTKGPIFVRLARSKRVNSLFSGPQTPAVAVEETGRIDIFGLLPQDIQIEVLGYVAADRPAQTLLMRKVCKRWRDILSDDSIYHSALFTASFTLPPPTPSLDAFQNVAFTDDRIRRHRLWKGRVIHYERCKQPENDNSRPNTVIYRDGFIVWWVTTGGYFNYVDLNQDKRRKRSNTVNPAYSSRWAPPLRSPLYAQAGGKLVFMRPRVPQDVDIEDQGWGEKRKDRILNVVLLRCPLVKGVVSLSKIEHLNGGPWELYCSGNYALVLKGLELLVVDIRDVSKMEVLHIIHLHEKTPLESPVINTVEISDKDNCLVVLTSLVTRCLETLTFSLTSGRLLKRFSSKTPPESREDFPLDTTYYVKDNNEFTREKPYQVQNPTHKEHPSPVHGMQHRWLYIPTGQGNRDEVITGSYNETPRPPVKQCLTPAPFAKHRVTFGRQAISFTALQDEFTPATVNKISLQITTGNIGTENQDSDFPETHGSSHCHQIGSKIGNTGTSVAWSRDARLSAPIDCLIEDGDNSFTDTHRWACQRRQWGPNSILLGDEKALILALPHHLMVWRFETPEIWKGRKKRKVKKLVSRVVLHALLFPFYVGVAVVILPFVVAGCATCAYKACTAKSPGACQNAPLYRRLLRQKSPDE